MAPTVSSAPDLSMLFSLPRFRDDIFLLASRGLDLAAITIDDLISVRISFILFPFSDIIRDDISESDSAIAIVCQF